MKLKAIFLIILALLFFINCDNEPTKPKNNPYRQQPIDWPSLADSPWPMHFHDPQFTGRSQYEGPTSGTIAWTYDVEGGSSCYSNIIIGENDTIYFCTSAEFDSSLNDRSCFLHKLDPNGNFLVKKSVFSSEANYYPEVFGSPLITSTGKIWFSSTDKYLYVFDRNLNLLFQKKLGAFNSFYGGNINLNSQFLVLSVDNLFKFNQDFSYLASPLPVPTNSVPICPNGRELFGGDITSVDNSGNYYQIIRSNIEPYYLVCKDKNDIEQWSFFPDSGKYFDPTVGQCIDPDGNIICCGYGFSKGWIFSISPEGKLNWQTEIQNFKPGSYPITDSKGRIYMGSSKHNPCKIVCLNNNGEILWELEIPYGRFYGNIAINSKGQLLLQNYFGGNLLCIE